MASRDQHDESARPLGADAGGRVGASAAHRSPRSSPAAAHAGRSARVDSRAVATAPRPNGQLVDWLLVASGFEHHDAVSEYWRWRNTWRHHWPIGPISNVASLIDIIADIEHDLDRGLDQLLAAVVAAAGRPVTVSPDEAPALIAGLVTVRLALSVDDRTGHGIVDDMPAMSRGAGLARTWVPPAGSQDSDPSEPT